MNNTINNKIVTITGKLNRMTRKEAFNNIKMLGGFPTKKLSSKTNILIVADSTHNIWTAKKEKCLYMKKHGSDIKTMSEDYFYNLII